MPVVRAALVAGLMLFAGAVLAQSSVDQCYAEFDASGAAECADRLIEASNVALDEAAAAAEAKAKEASGDAAEALLRSQTTFNAYRESACQDALPAMAGESAEQAGAACVVEMNEQRTAWLKQHYP